VNRNAPLFVVISHIGVIAEAPTAPHLAVQSILSSNSHRRQCCHGSGYIGRV
jgi:hypothetical protein